MKNSHISRRNFLKSSALASIPLSLSGFPLFAMAKPNTLSASGENDKVLVLVQLQGGNDGLATLFDANQYANLNAVRDNIIVPESTIINVTGDYGFHPSMQGMKDVWDTETLGIIQNVSYPNPNRSHFRSTDIWNSASSADEFVNTGWIGRFYDLNYSNYPNGFPNMDCPHPFALTMGKIISETCQGVNANYSLSLLNPANPGTALVSAEGDIPENCYGDALTFVNDTVAQTNAFAQVISDAYAAGNNVSSKWDSLETELSEKLKNVARLISGGLQTKVYIVQLGGFDTHDNQVVSDDATTGIHGTLLQTMSDAICAFQDDLIQLGVDDRVVGMTYSEFGRRIRSNAALGTDHGTAAPVFLFGSCIEQQILGTHPVIDTEVGTEEGVEMEYDFRDIYGTILHQWLGLPEEAVANIIYPDFQVLPILKTGCEQALIVLPVELLSFNAKAIDNKYVDLKWETLSEFNNDYFEIERSVDGQNFRKIMRVSSKGNSTLLQVYDTPDREPLLGISYYRLCQVDLNGTTSYSQIETVQIKEKEDLELTIYPQPAKTEATLALRSKNNYRAHLSIFNVKGQLIQNRDISILTGKNEFLIDVQSFTNGQYWVYLEGVGDVLSTPLVVLK